MQKCKCNCVVQALAMDKIHPIRPHSLGIFIFSVCFGSVAFIRWNQVFIRILWSVHLNETVWISFVYSYKMHTVAATQFVQVPIVLNTKTTSGRSPTLPISGWNASRKGICQFANSTKFIRLRFTLTYRRRLFELFIQNSWWRIGSIL